MTPQIANLCLQPPDLRLEACDVFREGVDGALLLIWLGRPVECVAAESFFKEPEEGVRPLQVGLVDPPGHRVGQVQGHGAFPSQEEKARHQERKCYTADQ